MLASLAAAFEAGVLKEVLDEFDVNWTIDDLSTGDPVDIVVDIFRTALERAHWLTADGRAVGPPMNTKESK